MLGEQISKPPYILGNFPRIEIVFACVDKGGPSSGGGDDRFTKLSELKRLLDDGALTPAEFEREKAHGEQGDIKIYARFAKLLADERHEPVSTRPVLSSFSSLPVGS